MNRRQLVYTLAATTWASSLLRAAQILPNGLILNYTFEKETGGLIRDKSPFGLHAPLGALELLPTATKGYALQINAGQSLEIPASSLLNPKNCGWIIALNVYAYSDGLLFSQGIADNHLALYIKDGKPHARIRKGRFVHTFKENEAYIKTASYTQTLTAQDCIKKWTTFTLEITPSQTHFLINRSRIETRHILDPFQSDIYTARIGTNPCIEPAGFSGLIGSIKLLRQPV